MVRQKQISDGIICHDGKCFSVLTGKEIDETILSTKDKSPINPHTGDPFSSEFVKKMRERYSPTDEDSISSGKTDIPIGFDMPITYITDVNTEPIYEVERPSILNFRKKNYSTVGDYSSDEEDDSSYEDNSDENRDTDEEESDEEQSEDEESEDESITPEYVKVNIGPTTIRELNHTLIKGNISVIFFYTIWCKFCKLINKSWEELATEISKSSTETSDFEVSKFEFEVSTMEPEEDSSSKVTFLKINNDYSMEIVNKYNIKNVPSFLLLKKTSDTTVEFIDLLSGSRIKNLRAVINENR